MVFRQDMTERFNRIDGYAWAAGFKAIRDGFESARPQRADIAMMNRQGRNG